MEIGSEKEEPMEGRGAETHIVAKPEIITVNAAH
jgi:hypothetical protein